MENYQFQRLDRVTRLKHQARKQFASAGIVLETRTDSKGIEWVKVSWRPYESWVMAKNLYLLPVKIIGSYSTLPSTEA